MKTQLRRPAAVKAKYTREFKEEALEHWRKSGRSAAKVGAELGIRPALLYRWTQQLRQAAEHGGLTEPGEPDVAELKAQIRRLTEENAKLLEQREVLKKSLGILSEAPPSGMPRSSR